MHVLITQNFTLRTLLVVIYYAICHWPGNSMNNVRCDDNMQVGCKQNHYVADTEKLGDEFGEKAISL